MTGGTFLKRNDSAVRDGKGLTSGYESSFEYGRSGMALWDRAMRYGADSCSLYVNMSLSNSKGRFRDTRYPRTKVPTFEARLPGS